MGLFKNMKQTMDQAGAAMSSVQQALGAHGGLAAGGDPGAAMAGRSAIQDQARDQNRIRATGAPGMVRIVGHSDTGEQAAGNPVWMLDLEVTPAGGAPYAVRQREIISSVAVDGYGAGTEMACHIDPADAQRTRSAEGSVMGFLKESFGLLRSTELKELARAADAQPRSSMLEGVRAANAAVQQATTYGSAVAGWLAGSATVQAIRDTGMLVNSAPIMDLDLVVALPGREPYAVTHRRLSAFAELGSLQPGAVLAVWVDPTSPNTVHLG